MESLWPIRGDKVEAKGSRVLLTTPYLYSQRGNTITTARLAAGLKEAGFSVDVAEFRSSEDSSSIKNMIAREQYDLLHCLHGLSCGRLLEEVPELRKLPLILTTTGTDINGKWSESEKKLISLAFSHARELVVFNSEFKRFFCEHYPSLTSRVRVIPQGVKLPPSESLIKSDLGLNPKSVVFLLPSGLRPIKNIEIAITAFKSIAVKIPRYLLIVGAIIDKDYGKKIMDLISGEDSIKYLGELPHEEMGGIMNLSDIVLNTSYAEGQPQAVLEAMSLGKTAILSAVPGNIGVLKNGLEGYYFNNELELRNTMEALILEPVLRERLGSKAIQLVKDHFSVEKEIRSYCLLYEGILTSQ